MIQNLANFLTGTKNKEFATNAGTQAHAILQRIVIDTDYEAGDLTTIQTIKQHPDLTQFFNRTAKTEVSIAGKNQGHFISRRIDRLLINNITKTIDFLDYKTDTDKSAFINQYKKQLQEYAELLRSAYPAYKINGYILWLQDWTLDKII